MKMLGKQVYRFDGVEVDPSQGCLRRNGKELPVRQKSLQALLYLLQERHRLVSKEELIARVWEGMAVSDDALVQLIKEIRQSLGDDPRQPRFIKTVPKAGYRFIATVEEFNLDLPGAIEIERHSTVEIEYEEEISDETHRNGHAELRQISSLPRSTAGRRFVPLVAVAAILILAASVATYLITRAARRSALGEVTLPLLPGRTPLAVMYFNNQSGSPDLDWLREGLADMLITNLSRSKRLNLLGRQQLHVLIERSGHPQTEAIKLDDAMEIAQKTRAEVIVLGSYARLGEKIRIDVQLHSAQDGQLLASESITADKPQDILAQVDLLSLKLAGHLGAGPEVEASRRRLDGSMTTNLEAYRNYSLALEKAHGLHNPEAIALLEKAIDLDPQFAMAHARLGYTYAVTWNFHDRAKQHLERAFQLSDRLSDRDRLYIKGWYAIANLDYAGAIAVFREIVAAYPMESEAYDRLSRLLAGENRNDEALEVAMRGLAVDPQSPELLNQTSGLYSRLGRHEDAIATARRYIAVAPNEPNAYDSLALHYQLSGHYSEAIAGYQQALNLNPEFEVVVIHLGNTYFQQGRYREALQQYKQYIKIAPSDDERARGYGAIADVYWQQGDLARSEQAAKQTLAYSKKGGLWHSIMLSLARGNLGRAEELSKRFFDDYALTNRGTRAPERYVHYLRGYIHLHSGRHDQALAEFKEALRHYAPPWAIDSREDCLANAYLELDRPDEAIAEYERIIRLNPNYPLAHFRLGQAYERKGQKEQARAAYERFLQVWKDADDDVPELISARKALA